MAEDDDMMGKTTDNTQITFIDCWLSKTTADMELRAILNGNTTRIFGRDVNRLKKFIAKNKDRNIFYGVGSRAGGGSSANIKEIAFLWADLDFKNYADGENEARHRLGLFPIRPSIVILSGGGLQAFWCLASAVEPSDKIVCILKGIASELGSDKNVCDTARIMRMPGTINTKYDPPRDVVIETMTDDEYTLDDFKAYETESEEAPKVRGKLTPAVINSKCEFLAQTYQNKDLLEPFWYAMVSNLCRLPGGPALCHEYSRGYPKYTEHETTEKILHSLNDGAPNTCAWIHEQGFKCEKKCTVKAPIVLLQRQSTEAKDIEDDHVEPITDRHIIDERPFPFDIFPERFLRTVDNFAEAHHVGREVAAAMTLTVLSGAIGNTIQVSPKTGYLVPPFLWLTVIAHTGYGKSPLLKAISRPIDKLQADAYQRYSEALRTYEKALHENRKGNDVDIPDKPKMRHFFASDATVESLTDVFADDPRGLIIQQDELSGLVMGLDQYKGRGNDRQHYLSLFNAGSWKIDRKSGAKFIPNTGAAIIGGIQTTIMSKIFGTDTFDDGLLPRFLLLLADNKPALFSRKGVDETSLKTWEALLGRAYAIPLNFDETGFVRSKILILNEEGLDEWIPFYNEYNAIMPYLSDRAKVFIPKLTSYHSLKFAGILHCLHALCTPAGDISGVINIDTIRGAIRLTQYFAGQAVKVLRLYEPDEDRLTDFEKTMVQTLHQLQGQVKNGKLPLSTIRHKFNEGLANKKLHHSDKQIGAILKTLGLKKQRSTGGPYTLIWEDSRIGNLFARVLPTSEQSEHFSEESSLKEPVHYAGRGL